MTESRVMGKPQGVSILGLWGLCLVILVLTGIAVWLVFPIWEVRAAVQNYAVDWRLDDPECSERPPVKSIRKLGGQERAAERLAQYVGLPDWIAPQKPYAVRFMRWCSDPGVPALRSALSNPDPAVRRQAAEALRRTDADATAAIPELEARLSDDVVAVRRAAAYALNRIAGRKVTPDLE